MRKCLKAAAISAVIVAGSITSALADGNGVVTAIKSSGEAQFSCDQFQTNGGPTWYGFSNNPVNNPGYALAEKAIASSHEAYLFGWSYIIGAPVSQISFTQGIVGQYPDCPEDVAVFGIIW